MLINEETREYESGDEADPNSEILEEVEDGVQYADAARLPSIVCTPRALSVTPSLAEQRCNLFQTRADVGNGRSCKVIIDGGSCHNLASKDTTRKSIIGRLPVCGAPLVHAPQKVILWRMAADAPLKF